MHRTYTYNMQQLMYEKWCCLSFQMSPSLLALQESYVWEMYLKKRWDFFPVGDSFRGQEERRQLTGQDGVASSRNKTKRPSSPTHLQISSKP